MIRNVSDRQAERYDKYPTINKVQVWPNGDPKLGLWARWQEAKQIDTEFATLRDYFEAPYEQTGEPVVLQRDEHGTPLRFGTFLAVENGHKFIYEIVGDTRLGMVNGVQFIPIARALEAKRIWEADVDRKAREQRCAKCAKVIRLVPAALMPVATLVELCCACLNAPAADWSDDSAEVDRRYEAEEQAQAIEG
jgi:hypothetical protein